MNWWKTCKNLSSKAIILEILFFILFYEIITFCKANSSIIFYSLMYQLQHLNHIMTSFYFHFRVEAQEGMMKMSSTLVETVSINYEDFNESFLTCSTCLCKYCFLLLRGSFGAIPLVLGAQITPPPPYF